MSEIRLVCLGFFLSLGLDSFPLGRFGLELLFDLRSRLDFFFDLVLGFKVGRNLGLKSRLRSCRLLCLVLDFFLGLRSRFGL